MLATSTEGNSMFLYRCSTGICRTTASNVDRRYPVLVSLLEAHCHSSVIKQYIPSWTIAIHPRYVIESLPRLLRTKIIPACRS